MSKINIRESLNRLDIKTDNKYDLRNTYDCSNISDDKKKELAEALNKNASAKTISRILDENSSIDDEVLYENDKFKIIYDGKFYNLIGKEDNEIYASYYNLDDAKDDAIKDPFYESLTESLDLSEVEEVKELPFDNKRVNNLRGIFSTKALVDALNKIGLDKFKIRTSRLKNVSQGDIKDAWMDLKRKGWSVSIERDDSLKGFNEVYVFEKTTNESLKEANSIFTVELYTNKNEDPSRFRFKSYEEAMTFAKKKSKTGIYETIMITKPAASGPSVVNSFDVEDGWFKESLTEVSKGAGLDESFTNYQYPDFPKATWTKVDTIDGVVTWNDGWGDFFVVYSKDAEDKYGFYQGEINIRTNEYDFGMLPEGTNVRLDVYKVPENDKDHYWTEDYYIMVSNVIEESLAEDFSEVEIKAVNDWNNRKRRKYGYKYYPEKYYGNFNIYIDGYKLYYPEDIDYSDSLADTVAYLKSKIKSGEIGFAVITDEDIYYPHTDEHVELWRSDNRFGKENYGYNPDIIRFYKNAKYTEALNEEEQLYKVVISSGATKRNFESALYEDEAEEIVDYYGGRWIDENGFEWDMYVEEDDDSIEHAMVDNSYDMEDDDERAQREYVESLNEAYKFIDSKQLEKNYPYYFHYESNNPFAAEDFWRYAESLDCLKVEGKYKDSQNVIFFVCPSEESYNKLLQFNKKNSLLPWIGELSNNYSNDYDQLVVKFFGKPKKLENLKEDIEDEEDFEYDDSDDVEEGVYFFADGENYAWVERIAGPIHLDFDNWAVWSAKEIVPIQDFIIGKNEQGGYDVDRDAYITAINSKPIVYFVVDEDTGFIDWGPVENQTEAQDFLNSKEEDFWNDEESEEIEIEEESLQESRAIKNDDDFEVTLHYDDIGNGKEYDYKLGYDEVVDYLREIAWSNGDGPEDANEDEYLEWVMDNFDELSKKYELNVLDYFEDEASQYEYDHRYDEP